jgi:hypothetical protein
MLFYDDRKEKLFKQFFTSNPSNKMIDIAEKFVPEHANVL